MKHLTAPRFYPIVDQLDNLMQLVALGFTWIQWRQKSGDHELIAKARQLFRDKRRHYWQKFLLNDDLNLARRFDFDGVHLGQEDLQAQRMSIADYRRLDKIVGISTHNLSEIAAAAAYQPSYLAFGPLFRSPTKKLLPVPPSEQTACLRQILDHGFPAIAIGGITAANSRGLFAQGFNGVAFIHWQEAIIAQQSTPQSLWQDIHLNY